MNICMIGCWYKNDMYARHFYNLVETVKKEEDMNVALVSSNCCCFSSAHSFSIAGDELINDNCTVSKLPHASNEPSKKFGLLKYLVVKVLPVHFFLEISRGISFFNKTKGCNIIYFEQVLKSFGFLSFFTLLCLAKLFNKKVVVTVHELDIFQKKYKTLSRCYNITDQVTVFSDNFKKELTSRGVREDKIEIIPFAQSLEPLKDLKRDRFIFFGGHKLLRGKGFDTLLDALKILKGKGKEIKVISYTGQDCLGLDEGKKIVDDMGLSENIIWSEFLTGPSQSEAYQKSIACIIPFTGGSGRHPVTAAMANATPVIATRKAALPEYLGELGIYIEEDSAEELADEIIRLIDNPDEVKSLGNKLREKAQDLFSSEVTGKRYLQIFKAL